MSIMAFARDTGYCKNLSKRPHCRSLYNIIMNVSVNKWVFAEKTEARLVATGLCKRALNKVSTHDEMSDIYDYIDEHPAFKDEEEEEGFKLEIKDLIVTRFDSPGLLIFDGYAEADKIKDILFDFMQKGYAESIAFLYRNQIIDIVDVAKCMLAFNKSDVFDSSRIIDEEESKKYKKITTMWKPKPRVKKLTFEEGFNIDVEELL